MKCGDTCRHNISKLNSGLSVKLLQLPLQRSGKALGDNLEGACSIFLQISFILVRRIYWIFRLLRGGWLGCTCAFVKLSLQRSGKALEENLEGACSIFLQKSFILVRHIYWIFRLLRGGWLGCTRAFVKWHLWPYPLKFSLWSTATTHPHCHCRPPPPPRARARSPRLVKPRHGWLGLAWYGMAWCESQVLS